MNTLRVAMISMHTSPVEQPGIGDAGGMNVYMKNIAQQLARRGVMVDIFTRATRLSESEIQEVEPGLRVINVVAGPYEGLEKSDLPTQLAAFTGSVLSFQREHNLNYDLIHAHYWLSGQIGWLLHDLWNVPLVYTAHTWAAVKNSHLALGYIPEPESRRIAEQQIVDNADVLIVNTHAEIDELVEHYDADISKIEVVTPGVDIELFTPGDDRATERARRELGIPLYATVIGFVGRLQKFKGPHLLIEAVAQLMKRYSHESIYLVVVGGASGDDKGTPEELLALTEDLGIAQRVRFLQPRPPKELARIYQAVDIIAVPSANESFGLVAMEAQACGTPVVASNVGGLAYAVSDGETGLLVDRPDVDLWAQKLGELTNNDEERIEMSQNAARRAPEFSWEHSVDELVDAYHKALSTPRDPESRNARGF